MIFYDPGRILRCLGRLVHNDFAYNGWSFAHPCWTSIIFKYFLRSQKSKETAYDEVPGTRQDLQKRKNPQKNWKTNLIFNNYVLRFRLSTRPSLSCDICILECSKISKMRWCDTLADCNRWSCDLYPTLTALFKVSDWKSWSNGSVSVDHATVLTSLGVACLITAFFFLRDVTLSGSDTVEIVKILRLPSLLCMDTHRSLGNGPFDVEQKCLQKRFYLNYRGRIGSLCGIRVILITYQFIINSMT